MLPAMIVMMLIRVLVDVDDVDGGGGIHCTADDDCHGDCGHPVYYDDGDDDGGDGDGGVGDDGDGDGDAD